MGHMCRYEHIIASGLFCVDIFLPHHKSGLHVVVEVDGPSHYTANDHSKPLGERRDVQLSVPPRMLFKMMK